jgi:anti-sigma regulatory factor (Ser/Thr protein kinase)
MLKDLSFPAKREVLPQMLAQIAEVIRQYFKSDKWINRLKVCAEEILVNIVDYSRSENVFVRCEFLEKENALRFEFVDSGVPYNPLEEPPEVDIDAEMDERGIGGLGIFLYTTIMDKVEYKYENGENHLITIKNCQVGDDKA